MKSLFFVLSTTIFISLSCNAQKSKPGKRLAPQTKQSVMKKNSLQIDSVKSASSQAIIRASLIQEGTGDKYIWDTVAVKAVLKNDLNFKFPERLPVARYSWDEGFKCSGEFVLYLNPFPLGSETLNEAQRWMVLEGKCEIAATCLE